MVAGGTCDKKCDNDREAGTKCGGASSIDIYKVDPNWAEWGFDEGELSDMQDLMKDYCYQVGHNTDYRDIFARRWWRHEKDSVSEDLFKTEEWFPAYSGKRAFKARKRTGYSNAMDAEAIDSFKCCEISYSYPA